MIVKKWTINHMQTDKAKANKEAHKAKQKNGKLNKVLKSIANIFIPLIPAFIGAGLIGGIAEQY